MDNVMNVSYGHRSRGFCAFTTARNTHCVCKGVLHQLAVSYALGSERIPKSNGEERMQTPMQHVHLLTGDARNIREPSLGTGAAVQHGCTAAGRQAGVAVRLILA